MPTIENRYKISQLLTKGGFGTIYYGYDSLFDSKVAIKIENKEKYLKKESIIYNLLENEKCMAKKIDYFIENNKSYLIMPLYFYSCDKLLKMNDLYFNEKDILMLSIQMLQQLNVLHKNGIIHNDIKPENFVFDKQNKKFKIIDFGLSSFYITNKNHIKFSEKCSRFGTLRYMSINAHKKYSLSRRDDLISLSYVLIYLSRIKIPWKGITNKIEKNKLHSTLINLKENFHENILSYNIKSPIISLYNYSTNLSFASEPDYNYLIKGFYNYLKYKQYKYDGKWSWSGI